jgi:serine protease
MAAPHVAGTAALLVSLGVTDPSAIEASLKSSARTIEGSSGGKDWFGAGGLDAAKALRSVALSRVIGRLFALALAIFVVFRWVRRQGTRASPWRPGFLAAALFSGPGLLFFAPFLFPRHNDLVDFLARPIGDWDLLATASVHGFLPLANVLWPFLATVVLLGVRGMRGPLAGFATGTAAYLGAAAIQGGIHSSMGRVGLFVFAVANALACIFLARLVLSEKR